MFRLTNRRSFLLFITFIVVALVLANVISRRLFFRWDLTQNKMYTLSESSRRVIGKLDDRLLVKVYFSDDLPGEYASASIPLQVLRLVVAFGHSLSL